MDEKLRNVVASVLGIDPAHVTPELGPENCEKWDSLAHVLLISEVQDAFGASIPFEKMAEIRCVGDFVPYTGA